MPRFAANLTMLFTEIPMRDRFAAAADAGFTGVEILYPYDCAAHDLTRPAIAAGLDIVLINAPPPNWAGGPRGFAAEPGLEERFRSDFNRALRVAEALRARHIQIMAGRASGPQARAVLIQNLIWAAKRAPHASLLIQPMSEDDASGWFLTDFDQAAQIIAAVGAPNLGLQFDAAHAQALTGNAVATFTRHAGIIRHVQIAGHPGRNEPDGDMIDWPALFAAMAQAGYNGWVGAKYTPERLTETGLGWLHRHGTGA